jgi:hypothetical protein
MSVNGISTMTQTYDAKSTAKAKASQNQTADKTNQRDNDSAAAVYEKSEAPVQKDKVYKRDNATVDRLLAEAEKRSQSLRKLVEKMLLKQGETFSESTDIYALLREGKLQVDPEIRAQAQRDIADDGYWGVDQTSERMLSFAKALTGGDVSKADEMIEAVKKGFEEATKAWGDELPDICKKTLEATLSKLEAWKDSMKNSEDMSSRAKNEFTGQASAGKLSE